MTLARLLSRTRASAPRICASARTVGGWVGDEGTARSGLPRDLNIVDAPLCAEIRAEHIVVDEDFTRPCAPLGARSQSRVRRRSGQGHARHERPFNDRVGHGDEQEVGKPTDVSVVCCRGLVLIVAMKSVSGR